MDLQRFNCFIGTARGVLIYNVDSPSKLKFQKLEGASVITALSSGKNDEILLGFNDGSIAIFDPNDDTFKKRIMDLDGKGEIIGLAMCNKSIIAAKKDGIINLWSNKKRNCFNINLDEKGTLETMVLHSSRKTVVGTGGEHNDFKLWDLETHQCIFKAKSLGHDMLNLPIPTSVRSIAFVPENEHLTACCTKEGQVLLYDDKVQRRPVIKYVEKKASFTDIATTHRERQCLVGTTRGYMQLIDMRMGKCLKTFKSFTGGVTNIYCHPFEPYIFTTSLDRFFRVHNLETKEILHKIYMKQNLTKILVKPVIKEEKEEETEAVVPEKEFDEEYEDIFRNMETVGDDENKRKRKNSETKKRKKKKSRKIVSDL